MFDPALRGVWAGVKVTIPKYAVFCELEADGDHINVIGQEIPSSEMFETTFNGYGKLNTQRRIGLCGRT